MKKILSILLISTTYLNSADWELWTTAATEIKLQKHIKLELELENRFKNKMGEYHYVHAQPLLMFKIIGDNYIGGQYRQLYTKDTDDLWKQEIRPGVVMTNKIKNKHIDFNSRTKIISRIRKYSTNRGAIRQRFGIDYKILKSLTLFVTDELFYHYNGFNQIDRNRLTTGISGKFKFNNKKSLSCKAYYLCQDNKSTLGRPWRTTNVLGIGATGKF